VAKERGHFTITNAFAITRYISPQDMSALCPSDTIAKTTSDSQQVWQKIHGLFVEAGSSPPIWIDLGNNKPGMKLQCRERTGLETLSG